MTLTYQIHQHGDRESIKCLKCGRESHNPNDVAQRYCSNCGLTHGEGKGYTVVDGVRFTAISLVSAPKCGACNSVMVPADRLHWKCVYSDCDFNGKPIHTGSYPIELARESK
jgi:ribosomal protein L37E